MAMILVFSLFCGCGNSRDDTKLAATVRPGTIEYRSLTNAEIRNLAKSFTELQVEFFSIVEANGLATDDAIAGIKLLTETIRSFVLPLRNVSPEQIKQILEYSQSTTNANQLRADKIVPVLEKLYVDSPGFKKAYEEYVEAFKFGG